MIGMSIYFIRGYKPMSYEQTQVLNPTLNWPLLGFLVLLAGPNDPAPRFIQFTEDNMLIGRANDHHISINDPAISNPQARIRLIQETDEEPHFVIWDLGSANGTLVNDETIIKHTLQDGDYLILGETELVFKQVSLKRKNQ
jgi:pSer/pThr/pTyr-binding forkhead associated (FHA) protein